MYHIELARGVEKQLRKLPKSDLKKIAKKIDKLAIKPLPPGNEKLKGHDNLYRVRQGDYRIVYSIFEDKLVVCIVKVGHRREVYR
ncbi:MAG: type II toxin-antitoxin system RelE/ParE family toxin [Simkaniaceae bacterium]|nr:type II toxin-antitoxin system RelE/ParE family toxin [Simkaniaceae bacterium]